MHGDQQLSLWNAHYDSRCFLPIHIYEATTGKPVAVILRPARRRTGPRWQWCCAMSLAASGPLAGGRDRGARRQPLWSAEAMAWCERQRVGYIFGLSGNPVLLRQATPLAEDAALGRLDGEGDKVRRYGDFRYAAKTWNVARRVIAVSRPAPRGPTAGSSSPICQACRNRSTRSSIAPGGRPKI